MVFGGRDSRPGTHTVKQALSFAPDDLLQLMLRHSIANKRPATQKHQLLGRRDSAKADGLAKLALDGVAKHCRLGKLLLDRPCGRPGRRTCGALHVAHVQDTKGQTSRGVPLSAPNDLGKSACGSAHRRCNGASRPCSGQTATRARPFARRALMTARPPAVFMRTRKPWVFLRRATDG